MDRPTIGQFLLNFIPYIILLVVWLVFLRAVNRIGRAQERIALAQERMADRMEAAANADRDRRSDHARP